MGAAGAKSCPCARRRRCVQEYRPDEANDEDAWQALELRAQQLHRYGLIVRIQEASDHSRRAESVLWGLAMRADLAQRHSEVRAAHWL